MNLNPFYLHILRSLKKRSIEVEAERRDKAISKHHFILITFNKKRGGIKFICSVRFYITKIQILIYLDKVVKVYPMDSMHDQMKFYDEMENLLKSKEIEIIKWIKSLC